MNTTVEFLEAERTFVQANVKRRKGGYVNNGDFVLKHGREFTPKPLPRRIPKGTVRECFKNAAEWVLFNDPTGKLFYCEGYASGVIPVHHAWLCNAKGEVIDRTWCGPVAVLGETYFGIPFQTEYLRRMICQRESWMSLIDDWENDWPLLRSTEPVETWKATL